MLASTFQSCAATPANRAASKRRRRGATLLEAAIAAGLLAVLMTAWLRVATFVAVERRVAEKRAIALQELAGAIERARALPWSQLTPDELATIHLSPQVEACLPGATLSWTVTPATSGPSARHIRAEIAWQSPTGAPSAPVRLSYWAYAPPKASAGGSP
jgi:Tfp pilus assembly protein PilV